MAVHAVVGSPPFEPLDVVGGHPHNTSASAAEIKTNRIGRSVPRRCARLATLRRAANVIPLQFYEAGEP